MLGLQPLRQDVDGVLQGLHPEGGVQVVLGEGPDGEAQDLLHRSLADGKALICDGGEVLPPLGELLAQLRDVHGVVGDAL